MLTIRVWTEFDVNLVQMVRRALYNFDTVDVQDVAQVLL